MNLDRFRDRFFQGAPRYRWLETLGRGGMGVVFKAQDLELDDLVAIKVLSPDLEYDEQELLQRFKREINLNRRIKHPNVARIHDFGTSGDYPYITMEYVPGLDLRTLIHREGRLSPLHAISIIRQIALGTEAAHRLGIIHRDLKSQNVMVEETGAVAILDFGLARGKKTDGITLDSIMIGTPHYMSPEQALGRPTDAQSDIYSIGVMAYECLTGQVPFTGDSPLVIAMKQVQENVPEAPLLAPEIPQKLREIVLKSLAKRAEDRFPSAAELEAELSGVQPVATARVEAAATEASPDPRSAGFLTLRHDERVPLVPDVPRGAAPEPPPAGAQTLAASSGAHPAMMNRQPVVLIADQDAVQRTLVQGYIGQFGCRVLTARNGQEALETLLLEDEVDMVLMDVQLSDMDGFDVTRVIKSQKKTASVPVVLMSGRLDRNRFAFGIQSGATDFLSKPLALESMIARLWNVLQHRGFVPPQNNETLKAALKIAADKSPISAIRP